MSCRTIYPIESHASSTTLFLTTQIWAVSCQRAIWNASICVSTPASYRQRQQLHCHVAVTSWSSTSARSLSSIWTASSDVISWIWVVTIVLIRKSWVSKVDFYTIKVKIANCAHTTTRRYVQYHVTTNHIQNTGEWAQFVEIAPARLVLLAIKGQRKRSYRWVRWALFLRWTNIFQTHFLYNLILECARRAIYLSPQRLKGKCVNTAISGPTWPEISSFQLNMQKNNFFFSPSSIQTCLYWALEQFYRDQITSTTHWLWLNQPSIMRPMWPRISGICAITICSYRSLTSHLSAMSALRVRTMHTQRKLSTLKRAFVAFAT